MSDPIDTDLDAVRHELLRARDEAAGARARADVLADRVAELESEVHELGAQNALLAEELGRSPIIRLGRAVGRRFTRS